MAILTNKTVWAAAGLTLALLAVGNRFGGAAFRRAVNG